MISLQPTKQQYGNIARQGGSSYWKPNSLFFLRKKKQSFGAWAIYVSLEGAECGHPSFAGQSGTPLPALQKVLNAQFPFSVKRLKTNWRACCWAIAKPLRSTSIGGKQGEKAKVKYLHLNSLYHWNTASKQYILPKGWVLIIPRNSHCIIKNETVPQKRHNAKT